MYVLKKIISQFFMPVTLILVLACAGLCLQWFTKRRTAGLILVTLAFLLLFSLSFLPVSDLFLEPLESTYKPLLVQDPSIRDAVKYIVILSGGHTTDPSLPVTSQINSSSLVRLVDGIRLLNLYPDCILLLSGGKTFDPVPEAEILRKTALLLGVLPEKILTETSSVDTETQVAEVRKIISGEKFILITAASHLPRAVAMFRKAGLDPIPAPAGFLLKKEHQSNPAGFFPNAVSLMHMETALHEYIGMLWSRIRGKI